jgi:hypothetical protein
MDRRLVSLAAVVGGFVGFLFVKEKMRNVRMATITVTQAGGRFKSSTEPRRVQARKLERIKWSIEPPNALPENAAVELVFEGDDSPMFTRRPRDRRETEGRRIRDNVSLFAQRDRVYRYAVWYVAPEERYCMEDPEIQIAH